MSFDARLDAIGSDAPRDGAGNDGPLPASCATLAPTCGPTGSSSCCESPPVPAGTGYRSYDVATDSMFVDMTNPTRVSAFRLDKYEVTVGRFRQFVAAGMGTQQNPPAIGAGARTLNGLTDQGGWEAAFTSNLVADTPTLVASVACNALQTWTDAPGANESRPMNCITWYEAMAFCIWDGGFLPTEAQWNYAAQGGSEARAYPWSSPPSALTLDDSTYASYYVDATKGCQGDMTNGCAVTDLVPAGSKPAGDGLWGHSDLAGNVYEWLLDWYAASYPNPCDDCANLTPGTTRVFRGGSFVNVAQDMRTGKRDTNMPSLRVYDYGVRCARLP